MNKVILPDSLNPKNVRYDSISYLNVQQINSFSFFVMSRAEPGSPSTSHKRRVKKYRYPPAKPEELAEVVNDIRGEMGLKPLKMAKEVGQILAAYLDGEDGVASTPDLIEKWMDDPSRRPVLLGPGNKIWIETVKSEEEEGGDRIYVAVASIFH